MDDKNILRDLAKKYAEIATEERFKETCDLYRAVNDKKMIRPVVLMDELPWHEMNFDGSLDLLCEDKDARQTEQYFKRMIYRNKNLPVDTIFPPYLTVGPSYASSGEGIDAEERIIRQNDGNHIVSHEYRDQLSNDEDIFKIKTPVIESFPERAKEEFEKTSELFDGILPVKKTGASMGWAPWDFISRLRGVTPLLIDLHERPEFCHKLMEKLLDNANKTLDAYEKNNLLAGEAPHLLIHCTPALCSDLAPCESGTAKSLWGRGTAQIFAEVSPEMHDEFEIEYQKKFMSRFGLTYYGCCEPLHNKIRIVEKIPNLRKIGITPWADAEKAADEIGGRYVMSFKPNPAFVAGDVFDGDAVRAEIKKFLRAARRMNASCDFVIKDISSCNKKPENLFKWAKVAMETIEGD